MGATSPATPPADGAPELLAVYLRDHLGGASAGLALVRRCRRANAGSDLDRVLAQIESEIVVDRQTLERLMGRLDVAPSRLKQAAGRMAELVGRVKGNGRIVRYSPLSRVVELEGLATGIIAKRSLWQSLLAAADQYPALDPGELIALTDRATAQYERVAIEHDRAAMTAFSAVAP